jgi:hypothetical protein
MFGKINKIPCLVLLNRFNFLVHGLNLMWLDEDVDPRNVNIAETEGHRDIEALGIELPSIGKPIKISKVNIGT